MIVTCLLMEKFKAKDDQIVNEKLCLGSLSSE